MIFRNANIFMERKDDFIYKEHVQDVNIRSTTPIAAAAGIS